MTLSQIYFEYSGYFEVGIVTAVIIVYRKKFNIQEWNLVIWFALSTITMIVAYSLHSRHLYNGWWYNIANFFQYGFPGYYYYKYLTDSKIKKQVVFSFGTVFIFSVIRLSLVGLTIPDTYSVICWAFIDSYFAFVYLKQIFEDVNVNPFHLLPFWFCAPAMLDAMCMLPSYAFINLGIFNVIDNTFEYVVEATFTLWHLLFAFGIIYTQWIRRNALKSI